MREAWTDERLDDLRDQVDRCFDWVDARFDKVDARFDRMDARFDRIDDRFERLEERITSRFDSLWRLMLAGYVTAVFGLIAAQL